MKLLTSNAKIDKSIKLFPEYEATILQMLPSKQMCVNYKDCISKCLAFTGFAKIYKSVNKSRKAKTDFFLNDNRNFVIQIVKEIRNQIKRAIKKNRIAIVRLNGFTDVNWDKILFEGKTIFELFPDVIFWDYTADFNKLISNRNPNYHLTFSYKGNNDKETFEAMKQDFNIAVIDTIENRDKWFNKLPAIDGDLHDFRFLDTDNSVVWLKFKK
tara:strand:+ start:704 stop:1342 length:639 start_codon:yes stop_codon:yes gene_type:complete